MPPSIVVNGVSGEGVSCDAGSGSPPSPVPRQPLDLVPVPRLSFPSSLTGGPVCHGPNGPFVSCPDIVIGGGHGRRGDTDLEPGAATLGDTMVDPPAHGLDQAASQG